MSGEQAFHFAGIRKPPGGLLRVDELVVQDDLEGTVFTLDQFGLDSELRFYVVRQTGGSRFVVSNNTVFDGQHGILRRWMLSVSLFGSG